MAGQLPPEPTAELVRWLADHGLLGEVLAVIPNEDLDRLGHDELRFVHGLLEAAWQLRHGEG
jgi:hypothetical protein